VRSAAAGIDYSRVEGRPGALRTTVTQNLICAPQDPDVPIALVSDAMFGYYPVFIGHGIMPLIRVAYLKNLVHIVSRDGIIRYKSAEP
jgi:hypothetical protein